MPAAKSETKQLRPHAFRRGEDPRRTNQAAEGNTRAAGSGPVQRGRRGPILTQQLIAALHEEYYETTKAGGKKKTGMTKLVKMIQELVAHACRGDKEAIQFCFERLEGKSVQPVVGRIDLSAGESFVRELTDHQLAVLEEISRKAAERREAGDDAKLIEHRP